MVRDIHMSLIYVSQPETEVNSANDCFVVSGSVKGKNLMNNGRK